MEHASTTLTLSAIIAVLVSAIISGIVSFIIHKKLVDHAGQVLQSLAKSRVEHERREKAQIVAELLSLWIKKGEMNDEEHKRKLTQLSFQCSLWLPKEILKDLGSRLTNDAEAKHIKEILADVRVHLGNDRIEPGIIVNW